MRWRVQIGDQTNPHNGLIYEGRRLIHLSAVMTPEDEKRLRLMGTAPELLEALKALVNEVDGYETDEAAAPSAAKVMKKAKAIISKAELRPDLEGEGQPMPSRPQPTLAIVCEGGLVQDIVSDQPGRFLGIKVMVIDYDVEGADLDRLSAVSQHDGTDADAYVTKWEVSRAEIGLDAIRDLTPDEIAAGGVS